MTIQPNEAEIRALRLANGLTQSELATQADVAVRTVKSIEAGKSVRASSLRKVALALDVPLTRVAADPMNLPATSDAVPPYLLQLRLPKEVPGQIAEELMKAATLAMKDQYRDAHYGFRNALSMVEDAQDEIMMATGGRYAEIVAQVYLNLIKSLDDSGQHELAVQFLKQLAQTDQAVGVEPWIKYRLGLALRRIVEDSEDGADDKLDEAEQLFREVYDMHGSHESVGASHQLGVVTLIRAHRAKAKKTVAQLRNKARKYFEFSRQQWQETGNFREAYSITRLAQLEEEDGNFETSMNLLLDALEIFARHEAERFRAEVRELINKLYAKALERSGSGGKSKK
ncbi:MAG: helix-turn-helix transcriptional regulator [Verrucomicrobiota bacterium]